MIKAFISAQQIETRKRRDSAIRSCMRYGIVPFVFDWDVPATKAMQAYVSKQLRQSQLFLGIYGKDDRPEKVSSEKHSKRASPAMFELQLASEHLSPESIFLFKANGSSLAIGADELPGTCSPSPVETDYEFALVIDETIKQWKRNITDKGNASSEERVLSLAISSPDRPGILAASYRILSSFGGNVIRSNQRIHSGRAIIEVLVAWSGEQEGPSDKLIRERMEQEIGALYTASQLPAVRIETSAPRERPGDTKTKASFLIEFFDAPGIAERIFSIFARESISVLVSRLEQISAEPPMAQFRVETDVTNISRERTRLLVGKLGNLAGVFRVDENIEFETLHY